MPLLAPRGWLEESSRATRTCSTNTKALLNASWLSMKMGKMPYTPASVMALKAAASSVLLSMTSVYGTSAVRMAWCTRHTRRTERPEVRGEVNNHTLSKRPAARCFSLHNGDCYLLMHVPAKHEGRQRTVHQRKHEVP